MGLSERALAESSGNTSTSGQRSVSAAGNPPETGNMFDLLQSQDQRSEVEDIFRTLQPVQEANIEAHTITHIRTLLQKLAIETAKIDDMVTAIFDKGKTIYFHVRTAPKVRAKTLHDEMEKFSLEILKPILTTTDVAEPRHRDIVIAALMRAELFYETSGPGQMIIHAKQCFKNLHDTAREPLMSTTKENAGNIENLRGKAKTLFEAALKKLSALITKLDVNIDPNNIQIHNLNYWQKLAERLYAEGRNRRFDESLAQMVTHELAQPFDQICLQYDRSGYHRELLPEDTLNRFLAVVDDFSNALLCLTLACRKDDQSVSMRTADDAAIALPPEPPTDSSIEVALNPGELVEIDPAILAKEQVVPRETHSRATEQMPRRRNRGAIAAAFLGAAALAGGATRLHSNSQPAPRHHGPAVSVPHVPQTPKPPQVAVTPALPTPAPAPMLSPPSTPDMNFAAPEQSDHFPEVVFDNAIEVVLRRALATPVQGNNKNYFAKWINGTESAPWDNIRLLTDSVVSQLARDDVIKNWHSPRTGPLPHIEVSFDLNNFGQFTVTLKPVAGDNISVPVTIRGTPAEIIRARAAWERGRMPGLVTQIPDFHLGSNQ